MDAIAYNPPGTTSSHRMVLSINLRNTPHEDRVSGRPILYLKGVNISVQEALDIYVCKTGIALLYQLTSP